MLTNDFQIQIKLSIHMIMHFWKIFFFFFTDVTQLFKAYVNM